MATIASQIQRIQDATNKLRTKGINLELEISKGVALNSNHKLNEVADAFDSIAFSKGETMNVELAVTKFKEDGTIAGNSYTLPTGFYKGLTIRPFFTQTSSDEVLNIRTISEIITSKSGVFVPGEGYNYMDQVSYRVQLGSINTDHAGYGNTYVTANVGTAGWLDAGTKNITVPPAKILSKVGNGTENILSDENTETVDFTVSPSSGSDTVLTINKGIYASTRTITVRSLASQMTDANATENDVLDGKIVYSNVDGVFKRVEGQMPNYGGTSSAVKTTQASGSPTILESGELIVTPQLGYYNTHSRISINASAGAATYKQTLTDLAETDHKFEIMPAEDTNGKRTTYLTQVTVDNSKIYELLAAI